MIQYTAFELDNLFEHHFFSNLDYFFAKSLAKAFDEKDPIVLASCAFVSKLLFEGHICLNISAISGTTRAVSETGNDLIKFPDLNSWINALQNSLMVSDNIQTPMVLDSYHRFYFSKYYDFQNRLARNITQRIFFKSSDMDEANIDEIIG
ncbi:MAG: hypothetical protein HOE13_23040, partial [Desulfobacula sp.]|nr:hypothetical protein [Desulfobacula sp.]